jgi:hypothetical protein
MNLPRQARCRLAAVLAAMQLAVFSIAAQTATNLPPQSRPQPDFFSQLRQLLAMPADERENFLTNRPPEIRERILAKVAEYEALGPDERELRLRATELRWYLTPLLREPTTNRAALLAQVPDDVRDLVKSRLEQWSILPPPLQQEFLDNERTLHSFVEQAGATNDIAILPDEKLRKFAAQVNQFFELTVDEKQKTLNTLSDAERAQMQKTLQSFGQMPAAQRAECVNAFAKFAGMDSRERAEFLKDAARWSEMSPAERQAWRDLVVNVPLWPPLPGGLVEAVPVKSNLIPVTNNN